MSLFSNMTNPNKEKALAPWLVRLGGLSAGLRTKGSPVGFPVRARAWVIGQVPAGSVQEATDQHISRTSVVLSLPPSLPFSSNNK